MPLPERLRHPIKAASAAALVAVVFTTLQTSYLMLFTVAFNCNSKALRYTNYYFPDKGGWVLLPSAGGAADTSVLPGAAPAR